MIVKNEMIQHLPRNPLCNWKWRRATLHFLMFLNKKLCEDIIIFVTRLITVINYLNILFVNNCLCGACIHVTLFKNIYYFLKLTILQQTCGRIFKSQKIFFLVISVLFIIGPLSNLINILWSPVIFNACGTIYIESKIEAARRLRR